MRKRTRQSSPAWSCAATVRGSRGAAAKLQVKGRSTDGYLWAAVNSERQLRSAAQRQHAAERVGAEGQRRAQRKEAAERAKQEKSKTELELGQQPTCPYGVIHRWQKWCHTKREHQNHEENYRTFL